ncbi:MAG: putative transposase [Gammaproteobacteria bacterium]|jgi:putative transposase
MLYTLLTSRLPCKRSMLVRNGPWPQHQQTYLITTHTEHRQPRFRSLRASREVVLIMKALHDYGLLRSHAFVLMPDHLHWLFTLHGTELAALIGQFKSLSARAVNRKVRVQGHLWQQGFHDRAIRHDESVIQVARYIVANPLRSSLVSKINDYPHWDSEWI